MNTRFMDTDNSAVKDPIGQIRILPIPYNATTTHVTGAGARSGPEAIIDGSFRVEPFDEGVQVGCNALRQFFSRRRSALQHQ